LAHFYGDNYGMVAQPMPSGGFQVIVTIPYEKAAAEAHELSGPAPAAELALGRS
jgi:hypothetical protein